MLSVASLAFSLRLRDAVEDMVMRRRRVAFASSGALFHLHRRRNDELIARERAREYRAGKD
jgi:hypothetical protein